MNYNKFTPVSVVINDLQATRSKKEKLEIIQAGKAANVMFLSAVLEATYNPFKQYGIKVVPDYNKTIDNHSVSAGWKRFINYSKALSAKTITGKKAKERLVQEIDLLPLTERIIAENLIKKDLRCGASATTFNKVFPGLIPVFNVALCDKANEKTLERINYPAYSQEKVDALRCCSVRKNNEFKYYSRNGKGMELHGALNSDINLIMNADMMIDGELIFLTEDGSALMPRKESNGLANKAIHGTLPPEIAARAVLEVWDAIPIADFERGKCDLPYKARFEWLEKRLDLLKMQVTKVRLVEQKVVNNLMEAKKHFKEMVTEGKEGTILKNTDTKWEGKKIPDWLKFKVEQEADLRILSVYEGEKGKKWEGKFGGFTCGTDDGKLVVNVGGGYNDKQREEWLDEKFIGEIVVVKYNEIIDSADENKAKSLYLPRFIEFRKDKDDADTLARLEEVQLRK